MVFRETFLGITWESFPGMILAILSGHLEILSGNLSGRVFEFVLVRWSIFRLNIGAVAWGYTKSMRNICPILLEVVKNPKPFKMKPQTTFHEKPEFPQLA